MRIKVKDWGSPKGSRSWLSQPTSARVAVYDSPHVTPRVVDIKARSAKEFIDKLSERVYTLAREQGGHIPYAVIREVVENLAHARFRDVIVSISERGNCITISDRGPGIRDKEKAFRPGYSTATEEMRSIIRGVGSGLSLVRESMRHLGGGLELDDNLERGLVVKLWLPQEGAEEEEAMALTDRQKQVLLLLAEQGPAGPSAVAKELGLSLATAYRDLARLEELGLAEKGEGGRRAVTKKGLTVVDRLYTRPQA